MTRTTGRRPKLSASVLRTTHDLTRRRLDELADPFGFLGRPRSPVHIERLPQSSDRLAHRFRDGMHGKSLRGEIHARLDAFEGHGVLIEKEPARLGDLIELFGAARGLGDDVVLLFEQRQRWIDSPRARRIGAAESLLDGADQVIAMARLLRDQRKQHQPQIAIAEHPAPSAAKEPAAAETAFILGKEAAASPSPARRAVVMPLVAATMIVVMTSKHKIYP